MEEADQRENETLANDSTSGQHDVPEVNGEQQDGNTVIS